MQHSRIPNKSVKPSKCVTDIDYGYWKTNAGTSDRYEMNNLHLLKPFLFIVYQLEKYVQLVGCCQPVLQNIIHIGYGVIER